MRGAVILVCLAWQLQFFIRGQVRAKNISKMAFQCIAKFWSHAHAFSFRSCPSFLYSSNSCMFFTLSFLKLSKQKSYYVKTVQWSGNNMKIDCTTSHPILLPASTIVFVTAAAWRVSFPRTGLEVFLKCWPNTHQTRGAMSRLTLCNLGKAMRFRSISYLSQKAYWQLLQNIPLQAVFRIREPGLMLWNGALNSTVHKVANTHLPSNKTLQSVANQCNCDVLIA